ncbi:MAG: hypothetical protein RLZZ316_818 [Bacteroidota bacterium]
MKIALLITLVFLVLSGILLYIIPVHFGKKNFSIHIGDTYYVLTYLRALLLLLLLLIIVFSTSAALVKLFGYS